MDFLLSLIADGWAKDDLIYQWKEKDPVQVVPGLHLPRFTLEQYKSAYCDVITNTGEFSGRGRVLSSGNGKFFVRLISVEKRCLRI